MSDIAVIKGISIKEGDVVSIKWKPISDIIAFYTANKYTPSQFMENSEIDYHLSAVMQDGVYKVDSVYSGEDSRRVPNIDNNAKNQDRPDEISIINHMHEDGDEFRINEYYIESIQIEHDACSTYFSDKFNISLMKIDGALYINGKLVTKEDGKLVDILESTISDLAIQKMLETTE